MTSLCVCRSRGAYAHSVVILLVNWSSFFLVCPAPPLRRGMWRSCHIWTIPEPSNTHSAAKLSFFLGPRCAMSCAHSTLESDRLMLCAVLHFTRPHAPHIMGNEYARESHADSTASTFARPRCAYAQSMFTFTRSLHITGGSIIRKRYFALRCAPFRLPSSKIEELIS